VTTWDDLNARARGFSTRLLGRAILERLAHTGGVAEAADELRRAGYLLPAARASEADIELAARRLAAARLRTLGRWAGGRTVVLNVVFDDEDRRSIRALLRGAAARAPADQRLSGLLPTPALPERALEELARQRSIADVVSLLAAWHHPLADGLPAGEPRTEPDLLLLETTLDRTFASRALTGAARAGRRGLIYRYVQELIDTENAFAAIAWSEEKEGRATEHWLPGGRRVSREVFERAVAAGSAKDAGVVLAAAFAGTLLAGAFAGAAQEGPDTLELLVLRAVITGLRREARQAPLSPAPLLAYLLRLRAEVLDVRWLVWGRALGAPRTALADGLVTA